MKTAAIAAFVWMALSHAVVPVSAAPLDAVKAAYQKQDFARALTLLLPLAESGDPDAQYIAGFMYSHGQGSPEDDLKALEWYRKSADGGSADSEFAIGLIYEDGRGVAQDFGEAFNWYRRAAERGLAHAQNNLGNLYNNGHGTEQNYALALTWYLLSANGGDERAQRNLDLIEQVMTADEITEAKKRAEDWAAAHPKQIAQP